MHKEFQQSILSKATEYAERVIRPRAGEFDRQEYLPREIIDGLASQGLLGAAIPEKYGGLGLDPLFYGSLTEIIGKACCSTRALLTVHTSLVGETLVKLGSSAQRERYLPEIANGTKLGCFALSESGAGSDASSVKTQYTKKENKFILNGKKKWITFGGIADIILVIAAEADTRIITAFIVERTMPGVEVKPMSGLLGSRAAHVAEISFTDVEVPAENVLCNVGEGLSFVVNTALFYGRYSIAWAGVAIGQAALEEMVSYARTREQFGQKIGKFQLIQGLIGDAVTQVHAARALCIRAGELSIAGDHSAIMETNIAKYFTSIMARQVTSDAVQVFGGNGCWNEYPVERLFRESKILEIIEGTSQIQQLMIANYGMRKYRRR
ncbi:Acyl-CoA dehydrogenase [compost metagenome]